MGTYEDKKKDELNRIASMLKNNLSFDEIQKKWETFIKEFGIKLSKNNLNLIIEYLFKHAEIDPNKALKDKFVNSARPIIKAIGEQRKSK